MYTIVKLSGELEERVRRAVARSHRQGRGLPDYVLAPELVDRPPAHIDGFLVMGSRMVRPGELCLVARPVGRPRVSYVG